MSESVTPNPAGFKWLAKDCRGRAINEWLYQSKLSTSLAAEKLNEKAVSMGLIQRVVAPKGASLTDWIKKNSSPLWACKAALILCLESGWRPVSASDWAMYAYFFIRMNKDCKTLAELTERITPDMDKLCALGWICAALEENNSHVNRASK